MRLIDADEIRNDWLENGENERIYDTNDFLDSIDEQPTIDPETLPIVQGLRANIAVLENIIERNSNPIDKDKIVTLTIENSDLKQQLSKVTVERDAAIKDMKHSDNCDVCISKVPSNCDLECLECKLDCRCKTCRNESNWQWRGIREGRSDGMDKR